MLYESILLELNSGNDDDDDEGIAIVTRGRRCTITTFLLYVLLSQMTYNTQATSPKTDLP